MSELGTTRKLNAAQWLAHDSLLDRDRVAEFHISSLYDALSPDGLHEVRMLALARCRGFIERRDPVGFPGSHEGDTASSQVASAFVGTAWPPEMVQELAVLLQSYARAGYLDLGAPLGSLSGSGEYVHSPSALEYAIKKGRAQAMMALTDAGAPFAKVPSKPFQPEYRSIIIQPGDIIGFAEVQRVENVDEMVSCARAAVLKRRIQEVSPELKAASLQTTRRSPI